MKTALTMLAAIVVGFLAGVAFRGHTCNSAHRQTLQSLEACASMGIADKCIESAVESSANP